MKTLFAAADQYYKLASDLISLGGIFEAPPEMYEEIKDWAVGIYAGHVGAILESKIPGMYNPVGSSDARIDEVKGIIDRLPMDLDRLKEGEAVKYKLYKNNKEEFLGVRRIKGEYYDPVTNTNRIGYSDTSGYQPLYQFGTGARLSYRGGVELPGGRFYPNTLTKDKVIDLINSKVDACLSVLERNRSYDIDRGRMASSKASLVEVGRVINLCKKYNTNFKKYINNATREFEVDLTGWKYLNRIEKEAREYNLKLLKTSRDVFNMAVSIYDYGVSLDPLSFEWDSEFFKQLRFVKDKEYIIVGDNYNFYWTSDKIIEAIKNRIPPDSPKINGIDLVDFERSLVPGSMVYTRDLLISSNLNPIIVRLNFVPDTSRLGVYTSVRNRIEIEIPTIIPMNESSFNYNLLSIMETIRHELQHFGQMALKQAKVKNAPLSFVNLNYGVVGSRLRSKNLSGKIPHGLLEYEFYTDLADECTQFIYRYGRDDLNHQVDFKRWIDNRQFFIDLKNLNMDKYTKAVNEFYKKVSSSGIDLSGSGSLSQ